MLPFAHLGIGSTMAAPWSRDLPKRALLLGTLLPDLIDKTLYYSLYLATGQWGEKLGLIAGTRTFGHSGLFLIAVTALALFRGSRTAVALGLGILTHLLLDVAADGVRAFDTAPTVH